MKIAYIGCVESSYKFLEVLLNNNANIVAVITKKESKYNSDFCDITPLCIAHNIPYIYIDDINSKEVIDFINCYSPDIGYCFGWSQLIKEYIINLFPKGIIGYHPAALPNNRGRHPIIWALVLGLNETASTFFKIDTNVDTGAILSQEKTTIAYYDDASSLMKKLLVLGCKQIVELTRKLENNTVELLFQNKEEGNFWRKRNYLDGMIDWRMSSRSIYNLVRALTKPYVGAHFMFKGKEIKVWKVREICSKNQEYKNIEPGKVITVNENTFQVKTGDNIIEVLEYNSIDIHEGEYLR